MHSQHFLPYDGQIALDDFSRAMAKAPSILCTGPRARLRAVGVRLPTGSFGIFACRLDVTTAGPTNRRLIRASDVSLIDDSIDCAAFDDPVGLRQFLFDWRREVGGPTTWPHLENAISITRRDSEGTTPPRWEGNIYGLNPEVANHSVRRGPVANEEDDFFAPSIQEAAADWLGQPELKRQHGIGNEVWVQLWDARAFVSDLQFRQGALSASFTKNTSSPVFYRVAVDGMKGADIGRTPIPSASTSIPIPSGASECRLFVVLKDNTILDERRLRLTQPAERGSTRLHVLGGPPSLGGLRNLVVGDLDISDAEVRPTSMTKTRGGETTSLASSSGYVDPAQLEHLRQVKNARFDTRRLVTICEELDAAFAASHFLSCAALLRMFLDHIPPVFGMKNFDQVASQHGGPNSSFGKALGKLRTSTDISNAHIHRQIRRRESLPSRSQIDFRQELGLLLEETIRLLEE